MSSFVKKTKSKSPSSSSSSSSPSPTAHLSGTRPWLNSSVLISTGQRDLDSILSGGQPLQTALHICEDRFTDYGTTLGRYWAGEGVAAGHKIHVVDFLSPELPLLPLLLPLDMNLKKAERKIESSQPAIENLALIEEDEEDGWDSEKDDKADDSELKIAWQYKQSVQETRGVATKSSPSPASRSVYCHSFDLSKDMQQSSLDAEPPVRHNLRAAATSPPDLFKALVAVLPPPGETAQCVHRFWLRRPPFEHAAGALTMFMAHVRSLNLPVAVCITTQGWLTPDLESQASLTSLLRAADTVLKCDSFGGLRDPAPPEFRDYVGIVSVSKVGGVGGYVPKKPLAMRYGIKRDRRKLHIKMLHLPPEDYSAGGGSVGGGARGGGGLEAGKKKAGGGGGMGCNSGMGGANPLDF